MGTRVKLSFNYSTNDFLQILQIPNSPKFNQFVHHLQDPNTEAYYFEMPAMNNFTTNSPFECILEFAPGLTRSPNPSAFMDHFHGPGNVAVFDNLGRDATLVAPKPLPGVDHKCYTHLAAFMKRAPPHQVREFWQAAGKTALRLMDTHPNKTIWMSTAGGGVPWLHLRFDSSPKYYTYTPYKQDVAGARQNEPVGRAGGICGFFGISGDGGSGCSEQPGGNAKKGQSYRNSAGGLHVP